MREYKEGDWMFVRHHTDHKYIEYLVSYDFALYFERTWDHDVFGPDKGIPEGNGVDTFGFRSVGWNPHYEDQTLDTNELIKGHPVHLFIYYEDYEVLHARDEAEVRWDDAANSTTGEFEYLF